MAYALHLSTLHFGFGEGVVRNVIFFSDKPLPY